MTGFLEFYKDTVIPEILSTIERLKAVLQGKRTAFSISVQYNKCCSWLNQCALIFLESNEDRSLDEASRPVSSSEGSSVGVPLILS